MRWLSLSLLAFLSVFAPRLALAQQHDAALVELDTVETRGDTADRSAFGRVMDVMIAALVQQHEQRRRAAATKQDANAVESGNIASLRPAKPAKPTRIEAPRIEISLGERFRLPPPSVASAASDDTSSP